MRVFPPKFGNKIISISNNRVVSMMIKNNSRARLPRVNFVNPTILTLGVALPFDEVPNSALNRVKMPRQYSG